VTDTVARIAAVLTGRGQTLAVVECTLGGALGAAFTALPGASTWFVASLAPYSTQAKQQLLGVTLAGAVSPEAARALAAAARDRLGADWTLAETGIAGPRGTRRSSKDPGTWFACLSGPEGVRERALETGLDDRLANRAAFLKAALALLSEI
jgi:nicotinamide-nucleotide amidase